MSDIPCERMRNEQNENEKKKKIYLNLLPTPKCCISFTQHKTCTDSVILSNNQLKLLNAPELCPNNSPG